MRMERAEVGAPDPSPDQGQGPGPRPRWWRRWLPVLAKPLRRGALLYWLPPGDPAWPEVALTVGRLSYDRYRDSWPQAEPADPDDLDAACDLLMGAARDQDVDERTTLYLVLALRDRHRLLGCPADSRALTQWGERLLALERQPRSA